MCGSMVDIHMQLLRLGEEKTKKKRRKKQDKNIISTSAMQGGHNYPLTAPGVVLFSLTIMLIENCQILLLLHPFNGLSSRTTSVSLYQKGKPFWILLEQEMMGCQWHQLDYMQIICNSPQTDNHASTSPLMETKQFSLT